MIPKKVEAVAKWETPKHISELRSFTGLANYFRKYLANYARHMAPLNELLRKNIPWCWNDAQEKAFQWAKHALQHAPVLAMPDFSKPFKVICDASGFATGGVLLQDDRPIAYESKKLSDAERNYTVGEQEL